MAIFKPEGADNNNFFPAINNLIDELQKGIVERIKDSLVKQMTDAGYSPEEIEKKLNA